MYAICSNWNDSKFVRAYKINFQILNPYKICEAIQKNISKFECTEYLWRLTKNCFKISNHTIFVRSHNPNLRGEKYFMNSSYWRNGFFKFLDVFTITIKIMIQTFSNIPFFSLKFEISFFKSHPSWSNFKFTACYYSIPHYKRVSFNIVLYSLLEENDEIIISCVLKISNFL